jgi:large subunit ribosomal protein L18
MFGTPERPRLSVFRSNRYLSLQLIDDRSGRTLMSETTKGRSEKTSPERARAIGKVVAEKARVMHITKVVFDRGGFLYAGSVRAAAEGAREGGLQF